MDKNKKYRNEINLLIEKDHQDVKKKKKEENLRTVYIRKKEMLFRNMVFPYRFFSNYDL